MFVTALLAATMAAPVPKDTAAADALKTLAGEWEVVESEAFGRKGDLYVGDVFKFDGDRLTHGTGGEPLEYRVRVDPKAEPCQLDWRTGEAGWSHRGIYQLNGDKLTVCLLSRFEADDDKDRPTEFRTKAGRKAGEAAGNVLVVLKRKAR